MGTIRHRSEQRRAKRRHYRTQQHGHDDRVMVHVSWCDSEEKLDEVRKQAHDIVIEGMGRTRTGPVSWAIYSDEEKANEFLDRYQEGLSSESIDLFEMVRHIRALVREYGGFVVVTTAPGDPRRTP